MQRLVCLIIFIGLWPISLFAKPLALDQVPEPLRPWISWVLEDHPERDCPFQFNSLGQTRCIWPSQLQLDLSKNKGSFSSAWQVYGKSWINLPGDNKHWPQNVQVNGKPALVMDQAGTPGIWLETANKQGESFKITGEFFWENIPDNLKLPADTGLINLSINGESIAMPTIRSDQLWLKASETGQTKPEQVENSVDIQVFRKITDTVPIQIQTRLVLEVSGSQREIKLPNTVPEQFLPLSLTSALPARIEPDGLLLVQLRPGVWHIDVMSRNSQEMPTVPIPATPVKLPEAKWPKTEIWVFEAQPNLRVVEIEQLTSIDASQTNLPHDWQHLPAFSISSGQAMAFKVIRRGDPDPEPNRLALNRKLWLDFDGIAYTVNDNISGTMNRGWRLNALPSTQIGKITLDGDNQLVTLQPGTTKQGVEVRKGQLALDADSRIVGAIDTMSAVGWEQSFNSVRAELNLPPGWRLFAASGVDNVPDSWVARWTLLDLFLVLIAALATARLWSHFWGGFALVTLVLIWHEPGSPHFVWLNILAATALLRVLPKSKLFTLLVRYRQLCWLVLVMIALPFMVGQVRIGMYPQLEIPWQTIPAPEPIMPMQDEVMTMNVEQADSFGSSGRTQSEIAQKQQMARKGGLRGGSYPASAPPTSAEEKYASNYPQRKYDLERIDPNAKVQTGPGLPQWQWRKVILSWNGSVDAQHVLKLWYLSPTVTLLLNFLRVILITILALLMFGLAEKWPPTSLKHKFPSAWLWLLLLPLLSAPVGDAYADFPDPALLAELKNRLAETEPPNCAGECAAIQQMQVKIGNDSLEVNLDIHAQEQVYLPIPADYGQWFPNQVSDNGKPSAALFRMGNSLWIAVPAGSHRVVMRGIIPKLNKFTLPLPLKPKYVSVDSNGWTVLGLQENGWADDQLQFTRSSDNRQQAKANLEPGTLPPFAQIERTLYLGLDWRIHTRVVRVSPADSALVLKVPLLPGEAVTSPNIRVKDSHVEVNLPTQQHSMEWQSTLEKTGKIVLTAPPAEQWIEVWRADISPIWHVDTSGIAMIRLDNTGQWLPEWHPWPGESVTLVLNRPEAVAGQTMTLDNSQLSLKPSLRSRDAALNFHLRSSQGGQHALNLPQQATLQSLTINGQSRPPNLQGNKLILPVNPGEQTINLSWQESLPLTFITHTPEVNLGLASVNSRINVSFGDDRWILFAFGPKLGPAILFWSVLIVIAIVSLGLGKVPLTPLKHWQWFLLLVGLSQIPMMLAGLVIAWLMALGWRRQQSKSLHYFNTVQVTLAALTLIALAVLFSAVTQGLLSSPDMRISGNQSSALNLNWYQDRSGVVLPVATIVSVPLMAYRLLMLAWSLWLAVSLLDWLKWGWGCFASDGLWVKKLANKNQEKPAVQNEET